MFCSCTTVKAAVQRNQSTSHQSESRIQECCGVLYFLYFLLLQSHFETFGYFLKSLHCCRSTHFCHLSLSLFLSLCHDVSRPLSTLIISLSISQTRVLSLGFCLSRFSTACVPSPWQPESGTHL